MIIVGDIGNTETKICLVNSKNIIVKRITLLTKKLSHSLLNKSLLGLGIKDKSINKCLFCSVVPKSFNKIKNFFNKTYKIKCHELKKLNLNNKITVLGIAKRLEEIYSLQDPIPLYLDKRSESLKLIQHMRNEAHRFAITFHRNKRSNKALRSSIDLIPGIGEKTKITLLKKYKSLKKIKETPEELIAKDVGVSKAKKLMSFLNSSS